MANAHIGLLLAGHTNDLKLDNKTKFLSVQLGKTLALTILRIVIELLFKV